MLKCLGVNCHDFCNSPISLCVSVCIPVSVSVAKREKANARQKC